MNTFPLTHSLIHATLFKYEQFIFELSGSEVKIMNIRLEFARKIHMPQTAFDILMFLGNNPECKTARDIVEIRKIKANLVSVNVDKLVKEGYLTRNSIEGDRRKIELQCTEQALPIIEKGRKLQQDFETALLKNTNENEMDFSRLWKSSKRTWSI